MAIACHCKKC